MHQLKTSLAITLMIQIKVNIGKKMFYLLRNQMMDQQFGEDYLHEVIIGLILMMVLLNLQIIWL